MTDKSELAELKKEVEALKNALSGKEDKPEPEKPFVPKAWEPYDPTAGMSMPPSALRAMVEAVPDHVMRGVRQDARVPTGRSGMIPDTQPTSSNVREPLRGHASPLGNPPGTGPGSAADKIVDEFDRRDRAELARRLGGK